MRRRALGSLLLAAATLLLVHTVRRLAHEGAAHRRNAAGLTSVWTAVARKGRRPLRIHALQGGDASVVTTTAVLVHGYGIGSSYFVPLAARLSERLHVLVPELPGHGISDHDTDPLTIVELAGALAAWMDARGARGVLMIGQSRGCQVIAEVAARRPELAARVVLIGPMSDPRGRSMRHLLVCGVLTVVFERPSLVVRALLDYRRAGLRVLAHELRELLSHRIEDVLPRVSAPACVIRGARDRFVPQRWADTVATLLRAPAAVSVPGCGHAVQYGDPARVARIVLAAAEAG